MMHNKGVLVRSPYWWVSSVRRDWH